MGSLSVYPWQRDLALPENDVTALDDMKSRVHKWAEKLDLLPLLPQRP